MGEGLVLPTAECSENRIKELKCGLGMERMPNGDEKTNALFFRIGVLANNLFVLFKAEILPKTCQRFQIKARRSQALPR